MDLFRRKTAPPPKEAAAKGMFKARATQDLQTVNSKLQAVETEIAVAEAELSKVSLAAVLADDQNAGFEAVSSLNELRTRRELLRHALSAAQLAENERLAGLRSKSDKARERALRQHLGEIKRQVGSIVATHLAYRDAFRKLAAAIDSAAKNLPKSVQGDTPGIETQLTPNNIRMLCEIAAYQASLDARALLRQGATRSPHGPE